MVLFPRKSGKGFQTLNTNNCGGNIVLIRRALSK